MRRLVGGLFKTAATASAGTSAGYLAYSFDQRKQMKSEFLSISEKHPSLKQESFDITKLPEIKPERMQPGHWKDLEDDKEYVVSLALKPAFEEQMGKDAFVHASLAIRSADQKDGGFYVFGRQSPYSSTVQDQPEPVYLLETVIGNEKNYLMPGVLSNFKYVENGATLTGAEIKAAMSKGQEICDSQLCDMLRSNCCTAAVYVLNNMTIEVGKRKEDKDSVSTLKNLFMMMVQGATVNFSQGVSNNPIVRKSIKDAQASVDKTLQEEQKKESQSKIKPGT